MSSTTELYPRGILEPDTTPTTDRELQAWHALSDVIDPEIRKPITSLGLVSAVECSGDNVTVSIRLTFDRCRMQDTIHCFVSGAVQPLVDCKVSVSYQMI